jgi:hypothetical protein
MKKKALGILALAAFSTAAVAGCGKENTSMNTQEKTQEQAQKEALKPQPLTALENNKNSQLPPGHPPINGNEKLPPGHPPINSGMSGMQTPPGHPNVGVTGGNSTLPQGHPPIHGGMSGDLMAMHSGKNLTKFDRPINIPPEVQKTWKHATIDIVDKTTGKVVKEFKVSKGQTVNYGGLEIKILYIVPHLVLDNGYTSASNEPQNPAILVEVKENGKTIYAGPIYQKFPTMYNINHPRYELILKNISKQ